MCVCVFELNYMTFEISSLSSTPGFTTCSINTDWKRRTGKCLQELWVLQKYGTIKYQLWLIQCRCVWGSAREPTCQSKTQPADKEIQSFCILKPQFWNKAPEYTCNEYLDLNFLLRHMGGGKSFAHLGVLLHFYVSPEHCRFRGYAGNH